ncbi:thiamine phosphate synthase [Campylobacter sp. FMV-PI01]|uniref:Thiamine-phosphate synthase n=1 Tax=Campylobacter portucalensis TaxID=2608384 RepID=A0A6L5WHG6_9BACT|nr:thiamine phosphate synthase [Campylobacter portucalensis]MSN96620.1 thiamine phosphate synthase [Campylobacter portucalensis]
MKNELYVLTDDFYTKDDNLFLQVKEILENGVKIIQFRSKKPKINENLARGLVMLCEDFKAKLIVNDNISLAKKISAHGIHLGKDDVNLIDAIKFLGRDKIYGVSCYDDINLAIKLQNLGASYVAFGAVFSSSTKKEAKICNINNIDFSKLSIPTCLIGGINSSNISKILYKNADFLAIVSAAYKPNSISKNLENLKNIIKDKNGNF